MSEHKSFGKLLRKSAVRGQKTRATNLFWDILKKCQYSADQGKTERDFEWIDLRLANETNQERTGIVERLAALLGDHGVKIVDLVDDRAFPIGICARWDEESTGQEE
jgi:hypothetical protein